MDLAGEDQRMEPDRSAGKATSTRMVIRTSRWRSNLDYGVSAKNIEDSFAGGPGLRNTEGRPRGICGCGPRRPQTPGCQVRVIGRDQR